MNHEHLPNHIEKRSEHNQELVFFLQQRILFECYKTLILRR